MSRENGEVRTCDRCGRTLFRKCIGEGEADGGYTRWNKFEPAEGWSVESRWGDLCPECTDEFEKVKSDFWAKRKTTEVV